MACATPRVSQGPATAHVPAAPDTGCPAGTRFRVGPPNGREARRGREGSAGGGIASSRTASATSRNVTTASPVFELNVSHDLAVEHDVPIGSDDKTIGAARRREPGR